MSAQARSVRVLLVDDHGLFRAGVRALLEAEADVEVVGEADTGEQGVLQAEALRPDVVLMDLAMPGIGGLEATRRITAGDSGIRVLVLTVHAEVEQLVQALDAGAAGYMGKHRAERELLGAIRAVAAGDPFLQPAGARVLAQRLRQGVPATAAGPLAVLSERERTVLTLIAEGYGIREIAQRLGISAKTVETYRARIMDKLEVHHRAHLVQVALRTGLLTAGP